MVTIHLLWFSVLFFDITRQWVEMKKMKYILIWTHPMKYPTFVLGRGRQAFLDRKCAVTKCFVTSNRKYYNSMTNFDMILFNGQEVVESGAKLPAKRSPHQIYVFASLESPANYPVENTNLNGFFNWTWTYKFKSDILFGYIVIKDKQGNVVGPKEYMNWIKAEDMEPIDDSIKDKLQFKRKAAAWFVSNCKAGNNRRQVALQIKHELRKFGLTLDIYGACGLLTCAGPECANIIENNYYFYLSFENSFGEDYVTEKLLRPLHHYAVPVVYGGANYTRFMPDGIYLNARKLSIEELVTQMRYLMNNKEEYYKYFRWHNHYSYHFPSEFPETDPFCNLCAALHDEEKLKHSQYYEHFDIWWNKMRWYTERRKNIKVYL